MNVEFCKIRVVMYLLAFGIPTCRNAFQEVVFKEIGLYPSFKIFELQTHSKGLLVKLSIKVFKVIAVHLLY